MRSALAYRNPVPRGPRRNLRPVVDRKSHPISCTSMGICPTDWQASNRKGTSASRATLPTCAAGLTSPPLFGVDLAVLVVTDDHDLSAAGAGDLQEGQVVAAVLGPAGEDAVARLERGRVEDRVPGAGGVLEQGDLGRVAVHQLGRGGVDRLDALALGIGGLVAADACFQFQVLDHGVDHWLWHQRGASVVEV